MWYWIHSRKIINAKSILHILTVHVNLNLLNSLFLQSAWQAVWLVGSPSVKISFKFVIHSSKSDSKSFPCLSKDSGYVKQIRVSKSSDAMLVAKKVGFETQGRHHQKSKPWISVVPQEGLRRKCIPLKIARRYLLVSKAISSLKPMDTTI